MLLRVLGRGIRLLLGHKRVFKREGDRKGFGLWKGVDCIALELHCKRNGWIGHIYGSACGVEGTSASSGIDCKHVSIQPWPVEM